VFLEDLDVKAMTEDDGNSRNVASMSWRQTIQAFKRHGKKRVLRYRGATGRYDETLLTVWM
jgi:phage terminase large subunit GpA-like protein